MGDLVAVQRQRRGHHDRPTTQHETGDGVDGGLARGRRQHGQAVVDERAEHRVALAVAELGALAEDPDDGRVDRVTGGAVDGATRPEEILAGVGHRPVLAIRLTPETGVREG
ncbi:hypothetical protein GCM10023203_53640 [Actinomycetospora straminea]|uniref:Uncharacterized protein n=1 Tax=Actinomycetospora straminea TaxID=663607 RepID=A0ABP9F3W0_9PSEU